MLPKNLKSSSSSLYLCLEAPLGGDAAGRTIHPATLPLCTKAKGGAAGHAVTLETRLWRSGRERQAGLLIQWANARPAPTPTTWSMLVVEAGLDNPALTGFWIRGEPKSTALKSGTPTQLDTTRAPWQA